MIHSYYLVIITEKVVAREKNLKARSDCCEEMDVVLLSI